MKKLLVGVLTLLLMVCLAACAGKTVEPGEITGEPPQTEEPGVTEEPTAEPQLLQVNIYHLGIQTPLDLSVQQTTDLAAQLTALLDTAAQTDSMDTAPADSPNPIQVTAGQTALELVYNQAIELPLQSNGDAPLTAQRLLYSIPYVGSDGGLLYMGGDIYEEAPLGKLFDQSLQDAIYYAAADQVERVSFSAGGLQVMINGQEYAYSTGDDSVELSGLLLNRMLYRSIAFYLNAYTGNVNGLTALSTRELSEAVAAAKNGQSTDNELGEETIVKLNQYILAEYFLPQTIIAPVEREGGYSIFFHLNEFATIQMDFVVEEDVPLVNALYLIMSDPAETTK